ncbi:MAG: putative manganese-dependent inorganic diphosphatase [Thermotoga sp.]|nr:putative manganese-dependent inorganic diphosphatase [Thermotoga sp.]
MEKVYVVGHRNPDTDSVCSAIGYAYYKKEVEKERNFVPARCGELTNEASFVLNYFKMKPPILLETLEPTVEDLELKEPTFASPDTSVYDVAMLMEGKGIKNVPVVSRGRMIGVVTESNLARVYVRRLKIEPLIIHPVPLDQLVRVLRAEVVCDYLKERTVSGKVHIAVDALHVLLGKIEIGDVVIVGDNEPSQIALLEKGARLMIIVNNAPVSSRVLEIAKEKGAAVLRVSFDAFGAAKLINLALPVTLVMSRKFPTVTKRDTLEDVKNIVFTSKLRAAFVEDEKGKLLGVITRTDLMKGVRKKVILVDHNEITQAPEGVEKAEILEIIDHHRLGGLSTLNPVFFYNEPVGSTSTIVTEFLLKDNVKIEREIAGILLAGIISDTLFFKLSTTTEKDRAMASFLARITKLDLEKFARRVLKEGMRIPENVDPLELLKRDVKVYEMGEESFAVSQIMTSDFSTLLKEKEKLTSALKNLKGELGVTHCFVLFTNPIEEASLVLVEGDQKIQKIVEKAFDAEKKDELFLLRGVMSRKKDFVPRIGEALRRER